MAVFVTKSQVAAELSDEVGEGLVDCFDWKRGGIPDSSAAASVRHRHARTDLVRAQSQ